MGLTVPELQLFQLCFEEFCETCMPYSEERVPIAQKKNSCIRKGFMINSLRCKLRSNGNSEKKLRSSSQYAVTSKLYKEVYQVADLYHQNCRRRCTIYILSILRGGRRKIRKTLNSL